VETYFIGWDVGGWNCEKNGKSRDAIVILAPSLEVIGEPWRGNLTPIINEAEDGAQFVDSLFMLVGEAFRRQPVLLGIDTPLGFSKELAQLVSQRTATGPIGRSAENPYLFRATERFLHQQGKTPLSPIKDMIGSQATKGMHVLARFAPKIVECGVWTDGCGLRAIEVYPGACKSSTTIKGLRGTRGQLGNDDLDDALTCALIAHQFHTSRETLFQPTTDVAVEEGWIWAPRDGLGAKPGQPPTSKRKDTTP
jgi:hypothetical protein